MEGIRWQGGREGRKEGGRGRGGRERRNQGRGVCAGGRGCHNNIRINCLEAYRFRLVL